MTPRAPPLSCPHTLHAPFPPFGELSPAPPDCVSLCLQDSGPSYQKGFPTTPLSPGEGLLFPPITPLPAPLYCSSCY